MAGHTHRYRKDGRPTVSIKWGRGRGTETTEITETCQSREGSCDRRIKVTTRTRTIKHEHAFHMTSSREIISGLDKGKYLVQVKCRNPGCPLPGQSTSGVRDRPRW